MKRVIFSVFILQFSLVCFGQSDIHHYNEQEVAKLTNYRTVLEKRIIITTPTDSLPAEKTLITALLKDTSHNYYSTDIIKIFKYIKQLEKKVAFIKMSSNDPDASEVLREATQPILLVKGIVIFEDSVPKRNYSNVSITITDKESTDIVGIYAPASKTGKYLFILDPGTKYLVSTKTEGYQMYLEDFFPKDSKESYESTHEIRLKKE